MTKTLRVKFMCLLFTLNAWHWLMTDLCSYLDITCRFFVKYASGKKNRHGRLMLLKPRAGQESRCGSLWSEYAGSFNFQGLIMNVKNVIKSLHGLSCLLQINIPAGFFGETEMFRCRHKRDLAKVQFWNVYDGVLIWRLVCSFSKHQSELIKRNMIRCCFSQSKTGFQIDLCWK